jgi:hypothetical protein
MTTYSMNKCSECLDLGQMCAASHKFQVSVARMKANPASQVTVANGWLHLTERLQEV